MSDTPESTRSVAKLVSMLAKLGVSCGLIGWLISMAAHDPQFAGLVAGQKNWPVLLLALPVCLAAVTITILRWRLLMHTLGLQFTIRETLRAGFLAYLANLLPLGLVAGDSLKAVMLIHRNPRRKTEALTAVFVDRVLGLFALLLLAAIASLLLPAEQLARLSETDRDSIIQLCWVVQGAALACSIGMIVMLIPAVTRSRLWDLLEHAPFVGRILHKLVIAMRAYRQRVDLLLAAIGISFLVHLLYCTAILLMTVSIGIALEHRPTPGSIFVIVPPSMIAGALPLGFYEVAITLLFRAASPEGAPPNIGLVIALGYRLIQISIATIGIGYWLAGRREVREMMHEAQEQPPTELNGAPGDLEPTEISRS
jgi:glycosyltransferase 2 family protein